MKEFSTFLHFCFSSKKSVTIVSLKSRNEKERNYFNSLGVLIQFRSRKNDKFSEKLCLIRINDVIDFLLFLPFLSFFYANRRIFTQFIRDSTLLDFILFIDSQFSLSASTTLLINFTVISFLFFLDISSCEAFFPRSLVHLVRRKRL